MKYMLVILMNFAQRSQTIFAILLLSLTVIQPSMVTASAGPTPAAWNLDQYCQRWGRVQFIAGASGAKLVSAKMTVFMQQNVPTRAFNTQRSIYCELTESGARSKLSFVTVPGRPVKGGSGNVLNLKATQYWCGGFDSKGKQVYTSEFWTTNDLRLPAFANDKYSKLCGLPPGLGTPLKVVRHYGDVRDPNHKQSVFLDTYKATPAVMTTAMLTAPTGYTKADEISVIMADELDELSALGGGRR